MTMIYSRRPRVNRSTRPAVIRQTPATFAAGLEDEFHADGREGFADRLVDALDANAAEDAWDLGYCLGREDIEANSIHRTHAERMAFRSGHERGEAIYYDELREEAEATIRAWEDVYAVDECETW